MLMNLQSGAKRNKRNSCAARDRHTALGQPVEQLVCDKLGCAVFPEWSHTVHIAVAPAFSSIGFV